MPLNDNGGVVGRTRMRTLSGTVNCCRTY